MCEQLLTNPLIESYAIELRGRVTRAARDEPRPVVAVVVFPGSNDDRDAQLALERLGADAPRVWHADEELPAGTAGVVLPGGFSFGDYLRCGAIARFSPIMRAVAGVRRRRRARARHLQRLPDPHRGRPAPGRAAAERVAVVRLPRRRRCSSSGPTRRSRRAATTRAGGADDPGQARRGLLVRRRRAARRARGERPARAALRAGREPERRRRRRRRRRERGRATSSA